MPLCSDELIRWLANGDRGCSSDSMVYHLTGIETEDQGCYPIDPDDVARCRNLLEAVPEIREAFPRMATCSPEWEVLVNQWSNICAQMDAEVPYWRKSKNLFNAVKTSELIDQALESAKGSQP